MPERNLDFDKLIDRRGTKCLKYDFAAKRGYPEDVLPLWVADMDFKTSSYVEDALHEVAAHNIYGYTNTQKGDGFFEAVAGWMKRHHDWEVLPEWRVHTPGVTFAIGNAIRAFTGAGDAVIVFSDEIHFDFIWSGTHCVFQEVRPEFREFTVTATSPSKTFNLAGAQQSNIFIPDRGLRKRFIEEYDDSGLDEPNIFGIAAAEAAYKYGDEWYEAVKRYIKANIDYVREFTQTSLPGVRLVPTEGTYLLWLDFRGWGTDPEALDDLIVHKAKLWLDSGRIFGKTGAGFQRINAACPGSVLAEALDRIKNELPRSHD